MKTNPVTSDQQALYEQLRREIIRRDGSHPDNVDLVDARNKSREDQSELFRSLLAGLNIEDELSHVERIHNVFASSGVKSVHELITDETFEMVEAVLDAVDPLVYDSASPTFSNSLNEIISYTVTADDPQFVLSVIEARQPKELSVLIAILTEMGRIASPLQEGAL